MKLNDNSKRGVIEGNSNSNQNSSSTAVFQKVQEECPLNIILDGIGTTEVSYSNGSGNIKVFDIEFRRELKVIITFVLEGRILKVKQSFEWSQDDKEIDLGQDVVAIIKVTGGNMTICVTENGKPLLQQQTKISEMDTDPTTNVAEDANVDDAGVEFVDVSSPGEEFTGLTLEGTDGAVRSPIKSAYATEGDNKKKDNGDDDDDDEEEFVEICSTE